jgi:hypothetical protein
MKRGEYVVVWLDQDDAPLWNTAKGAANLGDAVELADAQNTDAPVVVMACMYRRGEKRWNPKTAREGALI